MGTEPLHVLPCPWERADLGEADTAAGWDPRSTALATHLRLVDSLEGSTPDAALASIPRLLRQAADAIRSAEARARELEGQMRQAIEAAETRAKAAEDWAAELQERALREVRAAEKRAGIAEERLRAVEAWMVGVREAVAKPA